LIIREQHGKQIKKQEKKKRRNEMTKPNQMKSEVFNDVMIFSPRNKQTNKET
jgi:hypothetical protein